MYLNTIMDHIYQNEPTLNVLTQQASVIQEEYVMPLNVSRKHSKTLEQIDSVDSEVSESESYEYEEEGVWKKVVGKNVPKRPKDNVCVQDEEDENGYSLANSPPINAKQGVISPRRDNVDTKNQNDKNQCIKALRKFKWLIVGGE